MKPIYTFCLFLLASFGLQASADICGITLAQEHVSSFAHGERVEFSFEYSTDEPDGIRIFGRPFTNGGLTPGYGAHGSPVNFNDGVLDGFFTINSGVVTVDEIRVTIYTADQSELLREFWIPVRYHFGENGTHDFTFSEDPKVASFLHGEQVTINYDYNVTWAQGSRIFIRPFTNGALTPGYSASGSPVYNGEGSSSANFTINSGNNVRVDHLRVRMVNPEQNILLSEFFIPVNWYWSSVKVSNFNLNGLITPNNGENVTVNFDYETTEAEGVRIFPRPVTNGNLTPNYGACGSPIFMGTGNDDCNFTITANNQVVDQVRFRAVSPDQSTTYLEIYFPTQIFFGNFPMARLISCPPAPARLEPGERVNLIWQQNNLTGGDTRVFPRPFTEGDLTPGYGASGSPLYSTGVDVGEGFFTINSPAEVDHIRYKVTNGDQSVDFAEYLIKRHYVFGNSLPTSAESPLAPARLSWSVGPNPIRDQSILRLQAEASHEVNIRLIDALGRTHQSWVNYDLRAGLEQRLIIDRHELNLANGVYFLHVQGADYLVTETLVVQ